MNNPKKKSPEQVSQEGLKAYQAGDYSSAIQLFNSALTTYDILGNRIAAAEVANNLSVCYLKTGNPQKAFEVINGTDELFAQAGDIHRQGLTLGNQAAALEGMKEFDQAIEKYEQSSRILKEAGSLDERAIVLQTLSELHMKRGHQLDAMATMQIALLNKKKPSLMDRLLKKLLKIPFGS